MTIANDPNGPSPNPTSLNSFASKAPNPSPKTSFNRGPFSGSSSRSSENRRPLGDIPRAQDSSPLDARNLGGDFGSGGTNGSAGGFAVGGDARLTGTSRSQANEGHRLEAGGPDTFSEDFEHHNDWRDALPHNFRGWGPQTPDAGPATGRARVRAATPTSTAAAPPSTQRAVKRQTETD